MDRLRIIFMALMTCAALLGSGAASADPRASQTSGQEAGPLTPPDVWLQRLVGQYKFDGLVAVIAKGDCGPLPPDPAKQDQQSEAPPEPYCRTIKGKGDCVAIAKGPGVQCVLNVYWQDMYETSLQQSAMDATSVDASPTGVFELPGGASYLDPSMMLFGIDPLKSEIQYLLVDHKGMPEGGSGTVSGNRARFWTKCVNEATLLAAMKPEDFNDRKPSSCDRKLFIDARPDSKVVLITMDININDDVFTSITMTMRRTDLEDNASKQDKSATTQKPTAPASPARK